MREEKFTYEITDHACRVCLGRVLVRKAFDGRKTYRCSCCDIEREGASPSAICACGIKLRRAYGAMDSGIRCVPNTKRTPENSVSIVAVSVQDPKSIPLSEGNE